MHGGVNQLINIIVRIKKYCLKALLSSLKADPETVAL